MINRTLAKINTQRTQILTPRLVRLDAKLAALNAKRQELVAALEHARAGVLLYSAPDSEATPAPVVPSRTYSYEKGDTHEWTLAWESLMRVERREGAVGEPDAEDTYRLSNLDPEFREELFEKFEAEKGPIVMFVQNTPPITS